MSGIARKGAALGATIGLVAALVPGTAWVAEGIRSTIRGEATNRLESASIGAYVEVVGRDVTLSGADKATLERARDAVRTVPGLGVWTAAEIVQRAHGDPDTVSVGDYHLPALVGWALVGRPVDDDGMLELLEPWAGHRQRVMRLIETGEVRKPRFGHRAARVDHRRH